MRACTVVDKDSCSGDWHGKDPGPSPNLGLGLKQVKKEFLAEVEIIHKIEHL
jgi:hypothetical protein